MDREINMKRFVMGFLAGCLATISSASVFACTAIVITDVNGVAYSGKTMEFSFPIPLNMQYVPAGTKIRSKTPSGQTGLEFNTKYPVLGLGMLLSPGANQDTMVEGMNNQGLSLSSNEFNNSKAPAALGDDDHKILAATDFAMSYSQIWCMTN